MIRIKYALYQSKCRRCQKAITTSNRPLYPFMEKVLDLKGICDACTTPAEHDRIAQAGMSTSGAGFVR